jgi:hypothetical protein
VRGRGLTLAVCIAGVLVLPGAAEARTAKAIWGPTRMPDGSSAFAVYKDLGVDVFQIQLVWDRVAPTRPAHPTRPGDHAYLWPENVTEAVRMAREHGIDVAVMVKGAPAWANGGQASQWAPAPAHYARFLKAASRRYPYVHRWMIWGETNRAAVFQPLPPDARQGPRTYARLLDAAYGALKRVSRRNIVIGGMTFSFGDVYPSKWIRWMRLPNGKPPRLDWYGHNPFTRRAPDIRLTDNPDFPGSRDISDADTFAREVHRAYRRFPRFRRHGPPLWLSEFTVSSDRANRAFTLFVSQIEQARWLTDAFGIARRIHAAGLGWFNLYDEPITNLTGLTTGLMTYEGIRKPAYFAYKRLR